MRHLSLHPANIWQSWPSWCQLPLSNPTGMRTASHQFPSLWTVPSAGAQPVLLLFLVFLLSSPGSVLSQVLERTCRVSAGTPGTCPSSAKATLAGPNSTGIIFLGCFCSSLDIVRATSGNRSVEQTLLVLPVSYPLQEAWVAGGVGGMRGEGTHTFGPLSST